MTDRELLELAAKAADLDYEHDWGAFRVDPEFNEFRKWNPLTDDGDALRLAVRLDLHVIKRTEDSWGGLGASVGYRSGERCMSYVHECLSADPYAATRRAIVRAAAEIGKGME